MATSNMDLKIKFQSKLAGRNVLVIGGTSGIGFAVSVACLNEGAIVTVVSSQPERLLKAIAALKESNPNGSVAGHVCDLGNLDTLEHNLDRLFAEIGPEPLDHIVFTAATPPVLSVGPASGFSVQGIVQAGAVRFFGPLMVAKHAARCLRKDRASSLTLVGGSSSARPAVGWTIPAAYCAAMNGMARGLAVDLQPIRVNVVHPGATKTELWDGMPAEAREAAWAAIAEGCTTSAVADPGDVAEAFLYLMKDGNCSGSVIHTNGGSLVM